jgi:hypothetical protein
MTPTDTIQCNNPGHCPNHPVRPVVEVVPTVIHQDTIAADTLPIEVAEVMPVKKIINYSADSIQPVDVSLLSESTYHTFKIHEVRNQPDIEQPMNIDLLCNSLTFTFMLAVAAKYAVTCAPSWVQLFNELKQELS